MPSKSVEARTEPSHNESEPWFVYILRCADNSLYTGVTLDVNKRLDQHNGVDKKGAKYTQARRPVELVYQETSSSRSDACKREYAIKSLSKSEKESLINAAHT
ncbi:MAG: GIY-YIG nuclease family protein [Gammaproteobacteria bacterium]